MQNNKKKYPKAFPSPVNNYIDGPEHESWKQQ